MNFFAFKFLGITPNGFHTFPRTDIISYVFWRINNLFEFSDKPWGCAGALNCPSWEGGAPYETLGSLFWYPSEVVSVLGWRSPWSQRPPWSRSLLVGRPLFPEGAPLSLSLTHTPAPKLFHFRLNLKKKKKKEFRRTS